MMNESTKRTEKDDIEQQNTPMKKRKFVDQSTASQSESSASSDETATQLLREEVTTLREKVVSLELELESVKSTQQALKPVLDKLCEYVDLQMKWLSPKAVQVEATPTTTTAAEATPPIPTSYEPISDHDAMDEEKQSPRPFNADDFRVPNKRVDVNFAEGWFCGTVADPPGNVQIRVNFANGDKSRRLKPKEGEIRECLHSPQLLCGSEL